MAEQDVKQVLVRAARNVMLKSLSDTSVSVTVSAKVIVQNDAFRKFGQCYPCKFSRGVMDVYLQTPFDVIVTSTSDFVIELSKHQHIATTSALLSEILNIKCDE